MSAHPDKAATIEVLLETARCVAMESSSTHPEDIATTMALAIETAAIALHLVHQGSL